LPELAALDCDVLEARVHRHVDAVETVVRAAGVIRERPEIIENPELRGLEIVERQRLSGIAPE
jgi:hypothetical protein